MNPLRVVAVVSSVLSIALPVYWNVFVYPLFFEDYLQARMDGRWGNSGWSTPWFDSLLLCIAVSVVLGLASIVLAAWSLRSTHQRHGTSSREPVRRTGWQWGVLLVTIPTFIIGLLADGYVLLGYMLTGL
jgi:hypothetical protein